MCVCVCVCLFVCVFQEGFKKAMKLVGGELLDRLDFYQNSWLPARVVVEEAIKERHQVHTHAHIHTHTQPLVSEAGSSVAIMHHS